VRSPLYSQGFFRYLVLHHGLGQQPLQACVLRLKLLQGLGIRQIHTANLAAPEVLTSLREAVPAASNRQARFRITQEANDLFFGKSRLHVQSPVNGIGLHA